MRRLSILSLPLVVLVLAACGSTAPSTSTQPAVEPSTLPPTLPATTPTQASTTSPTQQAPISNRSAQVIQLTELTDSQGAVTVIVKPLELNSTQDTLNFEVSMDTHSIDLSMDLAALATLTTDTGMTVQAARWDAQLGGHHVSGTLSFPSRIEGKTILDGASQLTLIIKDVDTAERVFTWDMQ